MTIVRNQESLHSLISDRLDVNTYGVEFNTDIYNSSKSRYWYKDSIGQKYRYCPVMITDVIGEYINIPNSNSFNASVGVQFDLFSGFNDSDTRDIDVTEFSKVGYTNTLNAVEEFKNSLQAKAIHGSLACLALCLWQVA